MDAGGRATQEAKAENLTQLQIFAPAKSDLPPSVAVVHRVNEDLSTELTPPQEKEAIFQRFLKK